jgi:hypothetical protein
MAAGHRRSLAELVAWGTTAVVVLGGAIFGWLAWLQSHRPAPWNDRDGWWSWLSHVDGTAMFDASRTTATILAVIGVGGAALVAYRRQATAELKYEIDAQAHQVAIEAQVTAAEQLELDSQKYELDRQRHQLDEERRRDDRERELRARFAAIAEQLDSKLFAVRHAGAYALASLADDWHHFGNDSEREVCVNLLCAQLRTPRPDTIVEPLLSASDTEVRRTMVALLRSHLPLDPNSAEDTWTACPIDLAGADLSDLDFSESDLRGAVLIEAISRIQFSDTLTYPAVAFAEHCCSQQHLMDLT